MSCTDEVFGKGNAMGLGFDRRLVGLSSQPFTLTWLGWGQAGVTSSGLLRPAG